MVLLKLSAVSLGHSETDPKIKGSAYAAQTLLASYRDELVGYFQLRSQQCGWRPATQGSAWQLQMRPRGGRDRAGAAGALGLHWASASSLKWFLQDSRWRTTRAGAAFPQLSQPLQRNQPAGLWIIPESSGFCRGRSHQWNQNVLFQMERQTMHNMSWCTQCDRLAPATNEAAGVDCRYRPAVSVAVLFFFPFFFFITILASNSL